MQYFFVSLKKCSYCKWPWTASNGQQCKYLCCVKGTQHRVVAYASSTEVRNRLTSVRQHDWLHGFICVDFHLTNTLLGLPDHAGPHQHCSVQTCFTCRPLGVWCLVLVCLVQFASGHASVQMSCVACSEATVQGKLRQKTELGVKPPCYLFSSLCLGYDLKQCSHMR